MAKIFGKRKNIVILITILIAAAIIAGLAGITVSAAYGNRVDAAQPIPQQAVIDAALEVAQKAVHSTRSDDKALAVDLEREDNATPAENGG